MELFERHETIKNNVQLHRDFSTRQYASPEDLITELLKQNFSLFLLTQPIQRCAAAIAAVTYE